MRDLLTTLPKRKAEFIEPMNCKPVTKLADGQQWLYEIKFDGYRAIAVKGDGCVKLPAITVPCGFSKNHLPFGVQFIGRALNDHAVTEAAHLFQRDTDWRRQRPPIH